MEMKERKKPNQRRMKLTQRNFDNKHLVYSKCRRYIEQTLNAEPEWKKQHTHIHVSKQKYDIHGLQRKSVEIRTVHISCSDFCHLQFMRQRNFHIYLLHSPDFSQVRQVSVSFSLFRSTRIRMLIWISPHLHHSFWTQQWATHRRIFVLI